MEATRMGYIGIIGYKGETASGVWPGALKSCRPKNGKALAGTMYL